MFPSLASPPPPLDLTHLPPTYFLLGRLGPKERKEFEDKLRTCLCPLADIAADATLFIVNVSTQKRCELELRREDIQIVSPTADEASRAGMTIRKIRVVKLSWLTTSLEKGQIEKLEDYTILTSDAVMARTEVHTPSRSSPPAQSALQQKRKGIMERAMADAANAPRSKRVRYGQTEEQQAIDSILFITKRQLPLRRTTIAFEETQQFRGELPEWIRTKNMYSCCRSTPLESPNDLFISQLKAIKHARIIGKDDAGIRAYSTAIAAIKACPFRIATESEIRLLPGCSNRISGLFQEWKSSDPDPEKRSLSCIRELERKEIYQVLTKFESIWGVGAYGAMNLYFDHGYQRIGDIISKHWPRLSRVQQIGVKYYDEFLMPIPRPEVEKIATLIASHAGRILAGVQSIVAGGHRRGKKECGDVDVLLSHPIDGTMPSDFLIKLLQSLEDAELITHTLSVSSPNLRQEDRHLPEKNSKDTLDKALLVWQTKKGGLHRRVDIIIAPTVCAGTALLGWTGGITFERDLRRFCEKERNWKFSNEGVWRGGERVAGTEGWRVGESWEDVERRVMEKIGIGWRPPSERCTG